MTCWQCPRYDRDERRCLDGKANPKRKADSIVVAEMLGLRALCHYNPYRDGLAVRRHFPNDPQAAAPPKHSLRPGSITIDIEEAEETQDEEDRAP